MNWYRKIFAKIGDLFQNPPDEGGLIQYPFNMVQRDASEGWYIDDYPVEDVNIGDQVADDKLNMTPYWTVSFVNLENGVIYLTPIEPNPFLTGVGAGGKEFTDWDYEVQSGEYEKNRIDQILGTISDSTAADPNDVSYLLKGTVPLQMGPNGAQGGWYSPNERMHNRGGQEGISPEEIMVMDAQSLKKLRFAVPIMALNGEMSIDNWKEFVQSNGSGDLNKSFQTEGENYDDPKTSAQFILNHPQPSIKLRNFSALEDLHNPTPKRLGYGEKRPDNFNYEGWYANNQKEWEAYKKGEMVNKELEPVVRSVSLRIADMTHPSQEKIGFDKYWYLKEQAITLAGKFKWMDVLAKFENAYDKTNRKWVAMMYNRMGNSAMISPMILRESDESTKQDMIYYFGEAEKKKQASSWYRIVKAQTYEDVMNDPEEYSDPDDPGLLESYRYFSIGQDEESVDDSYSWVYTVNGLEVAQGGTHSLNFPHVFTSSEYKGSFNGYRGWYDPRQKMISVVIPRVRDSADQWDKALEASSLPTKLRVALADEFGTDNDIKVF